MDGSTTPSLPAELPPELPSEPVVLRIVEGCQVVFQNDVDGWYFVIKIARTAPDANIVSNPYGPYINLVAARVAVWELLVEPNPAQIYTSRVGYAWEKSEELLQ